MRCLLLCMGFLALGCASKPPAQPEAPDLPPSGSSQVEKPKDLKALIESNLEYAVGGGLVGVGLLGVGAAMLIHKKAHKKNYFNFAQKSLEGKEQKLLACYVDPDPNAGVMVMEPEADKTFAVPFVMLAGILGIKKVCLKAPEKEEDYGWLNLGAWKNWGIDKAKEYGAAKLLPYASKLGSGIGYIIKQTPLPYVYQKIQEANTKEIDLENRTYSTYLNFLKKLHSLGRVEEVFHLHFQVYYHTKQYTNQMLDVLKTDPLNDPSKPYKKTTCYGLLKKYEANFDFNGMLNRKDLKREIRNQCDEDFAPYLIAQINHIPSPVFEIKKVVETFIKANPDLLSLPKAKTAYDDYQKSFGLFGDSLKAHIIPYIKQQVIEELEILRRSGRLTILITKNKLVDLVELVPGWRGEPEGYVESQALQQTQSFLNQISESIFNFIFFKSTLKNKIIKSQKHQASAYLWSLIEQTCDYTKEDLTFDYSFALGTHQTFNVVHWLRGLLDIKNPQNEPERLKCHYRVAKALGDVVQIATQIPSEKDEKTIKSLKSKKILDAIRILGWDVFLPEGYKAADLERDYWNPNQDAFDLGINGFLDELFKALQSFWQK